MPKIVKGKNLLKTMKSLLIRHSKIKGFKVGDKIKLSQSDENYAS